MSLPNPDQVNIPCFGSCGIIRYTTNCWENCEQKLIQAAELQLVPQVTLWVSDIWVCNLWSKLFTSHSKICYFCYKTKIFHYNLLVLGKFFFFFWFPRILTSIEFEVIINLISHFTFHLLFILSYISLILLLLFFPEKSPFSILCVDLVFYLYNHSRLSNTVYMKSLFHLPFWKKFYRG